MLLPSALEPEPLSQMWVLKFCVDPSDVSSQVDVDWREQHKRDEISEILPALPCKLGVVGSQFYHGRVFSFILFYHSMILEYYAVILNM